MSEVTELFEAYGLGWLGPDVDRWIREGLTWDEIRERIRLYADADLTLPIITQ